MRLARRTIAGAIGLTGALAVITGAGTAQAPHPAQFLENLTGNWTVVSEAKLGPGQEPVRTDSRETARMLGTWLVAENTGIAQGAPFTSILTLGYDTVKERFVGTWISGRQTHMWSYTGSLDPTGTRLILDTEGPVMGNPDMIAKYREVIEVVGPDRRLMRSMILGPDGEWFEFQRAEYRQDPTGDPREEMR